MSVTLVEQVKTDGARLRALGADAVTEGLLRLFGHEGLELSLRPFVLLMGFASPREDRGKLGPGVRGRHIDDPHGLDARLWRIDPEQGWVLTILDAPPELALGGDDQVLIERIGVGGDLDPFAAAGYYREDG